MRYEILSAITEIVFTMVTASVPTLITIGLIMAYRFPGGI